MERRIITSLLVAAVLPLAACNVRQSDAAPQGDAPVTAMQLPVGPIPGGGSPPVGAANPLAHDQAALAQGRKLFVRYNCDGCHGGHAGGGMGPSLRDQDWLYGDSDAQVFDSISQGRGNGMPAWGTKLPQEQIWQIVTYVKSLRSPQEPDPPAQ
jgi:cytochrome c oxidase cbb3-type subunit III